MNLYCLFQVLLEHVVILPRQGIMVNSPIPNVHLEDLNPPPLLRMTTSATFLMKYH